MPVEAFLNASGVLIHANESGRVYQNVGEIYIDHASIRGIDSNLWAVLKICVDELKVRIRISSVDTGGHVKGSRHFRGQAADLWWVGPVGGEVGPNGGLGRGAAVTTNPIAAKLAHYLLAHGFRVGERHAGGRGRGSQQVPGILFGAVGTKLNPSRSPHEGLLHVSLPKRRAR